MSSSIRTIVFDLGKVLLDFDYGIAARRLASQAHASPDEIQHHLDQSPLLLRYEAGDMNTAQFIAAATQAVGFHGDAEGFSATLGDIFWEIPPMVALHAELSTRFPTFLLSNTNELAVRHVRNAFPFFATFTGHVLSYEVRAMKPNPAIYHHVETRSGCQGPEIAFIDDRLENIEQGRQHGWQTVHHRDPGQTRTALRALGLPV